MTSAYINSITNDFSDLTTFITNKYPDIISDDISNRQLSGPPMKIYLKQNVDKKPRHVLTARQIPLHLLPAADEALNKLLQSKIITPVTEPTEWISPAFYVPKGDTNAGLRLVTDFTSLNKYVERPVHPFPSSLEILRMIEHTSTVFCKMDAVQGLYFFVF